MPARMVRGGGVLLVLAALGCGLEEGTGGGLVPDLQPPEPRVLAPEPSEEPPALGPLDNLGALIGAILPSLAPEESGEVVTPEPSAEAAGDGAGGGGSGGGGATSSPSTPTPSPTSTPTPTPSPSASPTPSPTPTASPTSTPTPSPTSTPTPTPSPSASPTPSPTPTPAATASARAALPEVTRPGPLAVRGRVLLNGGAPGAVSLSLVRVPAWTQQAITTAADGRFEVGDLVPGDYLVHYYNETQRDRVGYWRSRTLSVTEAQGAAFPAVDLAQRGMVNTPAMDARVTLPAVFRWEPPVHLPTSYRFRVHSQGGRSFTLVYQSAELPGDATTFSWDGAGAVGGLDPGRRYFWGLVWDLGPAGEAGNLYQAAYFDRP